MALIGTIRKNSWLLVVVIGLALAAFIIMDMTSAGNQGGAVTNLAMGKVEGKTVDWNDFQRTEQMLYQGSSADVFQRRNQLWNYYVEEAIVSKQAEALGLSVSKDELIDLQFGSNPSPVIQNRFRNPQTGALDVATLNQIKQQISDNSMPLEYKRFWAHQEKEIVKDRLQSKINNMVTKGLYTPTWMVEQSYGDQMQRINFDFVRVPFTQVNESEVTLTDADFKNYLSANKGTYYQDEETRRIEYVTFDVLPTAADSAAIRKKVADLIPDFRSAPNDTIFIENNYGTLAQGWLDASNIPTEVSDEVLSANAGQIVGPYVSGNNYHILKVIDRQEMADSATSRHILIQATDPASFAEANRRIDSLKTEIEAGRGDFAALAEQFSDDAPSAANGGKYEDIPVNQFVPEYNDVMFFGDLGKLYKVRTTYGVHLVEPLSRTAATTNRVKIGVISEPIEPSEATTSDVFSKANEFLANNRTIEAMNASVAQSGELTVESSAPLKKNDFTVGTLGTGQGAREMVQFAFAPGTNTGDISPSVYSFQDPVGLYVNKYVVAGLKNIIPAGMPSVADIRDDIEPLVRNQKKGEILAGKISGTDLNSIATQFDSEIETAEDVTFDAGFVAGLGNEPKVIASAFNMNVNDVSQPIVGNNGVYVLKLTNKPAIGTATNIPQLRKNTSSTVRTQVNARLMQAMKKEAEVEDLRSKFY